MSTTFFFCNIGNRSSIAMGEMGCCRKLGLVAFLLLVWASANAQGAAVYPLTYESPDEAAVIAELEQQLVEDLDRISGTQSEKITEFYQKRTERLIAKIENGHFIFGSAINQRLENILSHILQNNPGIPKNKLRIFLGRYPWPNASCLGEGSMIFNIGLFRRLENDDQIAFILCHELAHLTENHVNNSVEKRVASRAALLNSTEFKDLQKQEYGRYEATQNLLRQFTFDDRRHSRTHEAEADDIGMKYYLNTQYSPLEATRCLAILDEIDREKYAGKIDLPKIFNNSEYPFQQRWLRSRSGGLSAMKSNDAEWSADSLKTHPDCHHRIELIQSNFNISADSLSKKNTKKPLNETEVLAADFEVVRSSFDFNDLGRSLYYSFQLLELYPESADLRATVGRCLYYLHQARKNHSLNDLLDFPASQEKEYRQVLQFLRNLRLTELKKINYHFLSTANPDFRNNEDYLFSLFLSSSLMGTEGEAEQFAAEYLLKYPGGKYKDWIEGLGF